MSFVNLALGPYAALEGMKYYAFVRWGDEGERARDGRKISQMFLHLSESDKIYREEKIIFLTSLLIRTYSETGAQWEKLNKICAITNVKSFSPFFHKVSAQALL